MSITSLRAIALLLPVLALACGGRALETPEDLPIRSYPSGKDITLTFVMESCRDTCSQYEAAECEVEVVEDNTIEIDVRVPYDEREDASADDLQNCTLQCGTPVFASCTVPSLDPGTYRVVVDTFSADITVR